MIFIAKPNSIDRTCTHLGVGDEEGLDVVLLEVVAPRGAVCWHHLELSPQLLQSGPRDVDLTGDGRRERGYYNCIQEGERLV